MEIAVKGILACSCADRCGEAAFYQKAAASLARKISCRLSDTFFSYGDSVTAYDISENASACVDDFIWRGNPAPGSRRHLCDSETEGQVLSARYFMERKYLSVAGNDTDSGTDSNVCSACTYGCG